VIIDLAKFLQQEQESWKRLEATLDTLERQPDRCMTLSELTEFHELYQRASADLMKISTASSEPELRAYLESLVARAYGEIHETRRHGGRMRPVHWFTHSFPRTFRRHIAAFWLSLALTLAGVIFGTAALRFDPEAKDVIVPFQGLKENPSERVRREESAASDRLAGQKSTFAAELMTHNAQIALFTMALGLTWGVGTAVSLFYNGVILGAVGFDYIHAGQTRFLMGWLLPHGAIEIPSILLAGQAGLVLAGALIGWGSRMTRRRRLLQIAPSLVTLCGGAGALLVWAGCVEAFLSQYHEPVIPYALKIVFGVTELIALSIFLARSGSGAED
jgi:uncharacterized membrane protein SpoIIM required for sporulation